MPVGQVMDANRHYTDKNIIKLRQQNYSLRHTIHIIVMYSVLYVSHVITILEHICELCNLAYIPYFL